MRPDSDWYGLGFRLVTLLLSATKLSTVSGQTGGDARRAASVRVVGGITDREGIALVTYDGEEGKLCDDGFDVQDAAVVCRMMGFSGEARIVEDEQAVFGPNATFLTNYILSDLDCDGDEPTLADCKKGFWRNTSCSGKSDEVGLTCLGVRMSTASAAPSATMSTTTLPPRICAPGELPSEDVRLVGGQNEAQGRVEVKRPNGTWGSICDDFWGVPDAQVICRMLCFNPVYSQAQYGPNLYGNSSLDFYLDDVKCLGSETNILNCSASFDQHNCDLDEPASVNCLRDAPPFGGAPRPELECSSDRITAKFDRNAEPTLEEAFLTVDSADTDCGFSRATDPNTISISIPFSKCNTNREKTNRTHITYSNTVRHAVPSVSTVITRTTVFYIRVSCVMPRNPQPELNFEPDVPVAIPVGGTGNFTVNMNLYSDSNFKVVMQPFPAKVLVGDWIFVGVSLVTSDENLKLVVPSCWATPTDDPNAEPKYYFIQRKCKVESSVYFYSMNETMFAFRFQSFKFLDSDQSFVYIHCESYICDQSEKNSECDRTCEKPANRRKRAVSDTQSVRMRTGTKTRHIRSTGRALFETDKGPLVVLDRSGADGYDANPSLVAPDHQRPVLISGSGSEACPLWAPILMLTLSATQVNRLFD